MELEIDNIKIFPTNNIVLSRTVYPLYDWYAKSVTFSKGVKSKRVPFMEFGKYYDFKYKDNGRTIFAGDAVLADRVNHREDEIQLVDKSKALFDSLANSILSMDLSDSDFIFNLAAYNTLKVENDSVWIWSAANTFINSNDEFNVLDGELEYSRPFLSIKKILKKAFSALGWTYELSDNAALFDKLILSADHAKYALTSYEKIVNETIDPLIEARVQLDNPLFLNYDTVNPYSIVFHLPTIVRIKGYITAQEDCKFKISTLTNTTTILYYYQDIELKAGRHYYDIISNLIEIPLIGTDSGSFKITITDTTNDVVLEDLQIYSTIDEVHFWQDVNINYSIQDFKVKTIENIENLSIISLLKTALTTIGGFYTSDSLRKKITINSLNQVSKMGALDWSKKFIENSEKVSLLTNYGKTNYYQYNNGDNKAFDQGRGTFDIDKDTLQDIKSVFKSDFAASNEAVSVSQSMLSTPIYTQELIKEGSLILIPARNFQFNQYIGYFENQNDYTVARFEKLNGNNIINDFYANFVEALKKGVLIKCSAVLNKSDFFNFDFLTLIYIKQLKASFYLIKMENYKENESDLILLKS